MDFPESRPTLKMSKSVEFSVGKADVFAARHRERCMNKNRQVLTAGSCSCSPFQWLYLHIVLPNEFSGLPESR